VPGVAASVEPGDCVIAAGEIVYDLAFPFVSPLETDD
jgi:hypothetical protein